MTIEEDQFTGENDQTLRGIAIERLVTAIEQLHQFPGITAGRSILQFTGRIEGNTSLRGVRYHKTDFGLVCQCHEGRVLCIGVQGPTDDIDTL